jgi:RNA polymerase sigma-70 factor, ECF subfamily
MSISKLDFPEIYNTFQPKILRYMARMVSEADAEDLTQEVFVKAHRALKNFKGEAKLSTWLYRIATNTALDKLRSPSFQRIAPLSLSNDSIEKVEAKINARVVCAEEIKPLTEQQLVQKEMNDCIRGFIERLPENYRTVLVLSEWEGLRNDEIAHILGITIDTVKIRLHRGKEKLKEELEVHCDPYWIEENEFLPDLKMFLGDLKD